MIATSTEDGEAMTKIFSMLDQLLPHAAHDGEDAADAWINDLLRHPDIARMDARELGDLPFPGGASHRRPQAKACHGG